QDEEDQELAFQRAFTLELLSNAVFIALLAGLLPLFCILYGNWTLLLPGYVIVLLVLPSGILRTPLWVFYRQMDYVKQRSMQAMEPIVALIVSLALAIAGAGYWALVFGMFAGAWSVAIVVALNSPYRFRFRFDRATMGNY